MKPLREMGRRRRCGARNMKHYPEANATQIAKISPETPLRDNGAFASDFILH